jgi:hypothetical protein
MPLPCINIFLISVIVQIAVDTGTEPAVCTVIVMVHMQSVKMGSEIFFSTGIFVKKK